MEQSVSHGRQAPQAGGRFLSLDERDELDKLASQIKGIAYLIGAAGDIPDCPDIHPANAAWALRDLVDRMTALIDREGGHD